MKNKSSSNMTNCPDFKYKVRQLEDKRERAADTKSTDKRHREEEIGSKMHTGGPLALLRHC